MIDNFKEYLKESASFTNFDKLHFIFLDVVILLTVLAHG